MKSSLKKACPDCGGAMAEVRLIDRAHHGVHQELEYGAPEGKRSFWTGQFPIEGKVVASMCGQCGRIVLHGQPKDNS